MAVLDDKVLRLLSPRDLALRLREAVVSGQLRDEDITSHLLKSIEIESLPPRIFILWLSVSQSTGTLLAALRQDFSTLTRTLAIVHFGRLLRTKKWRAAWDAVGGTRGLMDLLSEFSVSNVRLFATRVGQSVRSDKETEKQAAITHLYERLLEISSGEELGERPLQRIWARLLPSTSPAYILQSLADKDPMWTRHRSKVDLVQRHRALFQERLTATTKASTESIPDPHLYRRILAGGNSNRSESISGFTLAMEFSLTLLRRLGEDNQTIDFPREHYMDELAEPLLRNALKRDSTGEFVREIVELTVSYLQSHPETAKLTLESNDFVGLLLTRGRKRIPEALLGKALKLLPRDGITLADEAGSDDLGGGANCEPDENMRKSSVRLLLLRYARHDRYSILRLVMLHSPLLGLDIETTAGLEKLSRTAISYEIFTILAQEHARRLLKRLLQICPEGTFMRRKSPKMDNTILCQKRSFAESSWDSHRDIGDFQLLSLYLDRGQKDHPDHVALVVADIQRRSQTSRDSSERASLAKDALYYAIASNSIELYRQTLLWARRYIRDRFSGASIYSEKILHSSESMTLLSGIPDGIKPGDTDVTEFRADILASNTVLEELLDTTALAAQEPGYSEYDWDAVFGIFRGIVEMRLKRSGIIVLAGDSSWSNSLLDTMWHATTEMLIRIERKSMRPENRALGLFPGRSGLDGLGGPLAWNQMPFYTGIERLRSTAGLREPNTRFLDNLARARDELWKEIRLLKNPLLAELSPLWPRGLPIQGMLTGCWPWKRLSPQHTPSIAARAEAIVFIAASKASEPLPEDQPALLNSNDTTIRLLSDFYPTALEIYVRQPRDGDPKKPKRGYSLHDPTGPGHRARLAWEHAISALSRDRMTHAEALRFWEPIFSRWLKGVAEFSPSHPQLTEALEPIHDHDPNQPKLWDPSTGLEGEITERDLPVTSLDHMLVMQFTTRKTSLKPKSKAVSAQKWIELDLDKHAYKEREMAIACWLLILDTKTRTDTPLFPRAFPGDGNVRFPPLILDQDFLEKEEPQAMVAVRQLIRRSDEVPASLLVTLITRYLDTIDNTEATDGGRFELESALIGLIRCLIHSDRPALAGPFILRVILGYPKLSAWHRQLITKNFARRLSRQQAHVFFAEFAEGISARRPSKDPSKEADSKDGRPVVKVTTTKLLAQSLGGTEALPPEFSAKILSDLFQTPQVDIRTAALDNLLDILAGCGENAPQTLVDGYIKALEAAIPIAGATSEIKPLSEEEWLEAETTLTLPHITKPSWSTPADPIMYSLNKALSKPGISLRIRKELRDRILLPAIVLSIENNRRWSQLFAKKHSLPIDLSTVTVPPVNNDLYRMTLAFTDLSLVPLDVLNTQKALIVQSLHKNPSIIAARDKVNADLDLRRSDAGKHFVRLLVVSMGITENIRPLIKHLRETNEASEPGMGITVPAIQSMLLELAPLLLHSGHSDADPTLRYFTEFMDALSPPLARKTTPVESVESMVMRIRAQPGQVATTVKPKGPDANELATLPEGERTERRVWVANCRPLVRRFVALVQKARTGAWEKDPERTPKYLPDMFKYRLWLLNYPILPLEIAEKETGATQQTPNKITVQTAETWDGDAGHTARVEAFVNEVIALFHDLAEDHRPYHQRFADLKAAVMLVFASDYVPVACGLVESITLDPEVRQLRLEEYLRIGLAEDLFLGAAAARPAEEGDVGRTRRVLGVWKACNVEEVRMTAERVLAKLKNAKGWAEQ